MAGKRSVRLGSYYPVESPLHHWDARAKILAMLFFLTGIFAADKLWVFAVVYAVGGALLRAAHIPIGMAFRAVRGLIFLMAATCLLNAFFTAGEDVLWQWGFLRLTAEGIWRCVMMLLRLSALVAFSGLLTFTTTPLELADGMERLLSPFAKVGFPAHEFAMMMTIALRFIPILMEEAAKITKAQRSRGGDFTSGRLIGRLRGMTAVAIPLIYNALKRADDLAVAMEARAYIGGEGRVSLREPVWRRRDTAVLLASVLFWLCLLFSRRLGGI